MPWNPEVDLCWHALVRGASDECEPEWCESEDPLFILYTSGSTGKPKVGQNRACGFITSNFTALTLVWVIQGVLHTISGYMLYTATTFKLVFDHQPHDVYWCTADIGWITGHSYITYGPLANGATSVLVSDGSTKERGHCYSNNGNACSYGGIRCHAVVFHEGAIKRFPLDG